MSSSKPEWVGILEQQLEENPKRTSYAFSTLSPEGKPKVRYVVHRGITPSSLLLTTTDTRMQKPNHLASNPTIEFAWWIEETNVQFRVTGKAYTISEDEATIKKAIGVLDVEGQDEGKVDWWVKKRKETWEGVSGHLRAGFARPAPGTKLSEVDVKPEDWPERIDTSSDGAKAQKEIDSAYSHFALIAIKPEAAEFLELKPVPNKRTQWNKQADGSWDKVEVAP